MDQSQKRLTIISGIPDREKNKVFKELMENSQENIKLILFRETQFTFKAETEDFLSMNPFLIEAAHDLHVGSTKELCTLITDEQLVNTVDHLVIDISMFSNPESTYEFIHQYLENTSLHPWMRCSHMHVIDVLDFWFHYSSLHSIISNDTEETIEYTMGEILTYSLEAADTILLANTNLLSKERLDELVSFIGKLQPNARLKKAEEYVKHTATEESSLETQDDNSVSHKLQSHLTLVEKDEHKAESYIYNKNIPIDSEKLQLFFSKLPDGILRTKGTFTTSNETHDISQVGSVVQIQSKENYKTDSFKQQATTNLHFIGFHLDKKSIEQRLNQCLIKTTTVSTYLFKEALH